MVRFEKKRDEREKNLERMKSKVLKVFRMEKGKQKMYG